VRTVLISILVLGIAPVGLRGQDRGTSATHERAAAELIDVLQLEKVTALSTELMIQAMVDQNPAFAQVRDVFVEFFREFMTWDRMQPEYVRLYQQAYTEREITELIAFYRTPVGRKTVELMPRLLQQGSEIGQRLIRPHLPELQRRVQVRIGGGT
jgi:hypothetical protein